MALSKNLANSISDNSNSKSLGFWLRAKRIQPLLGMAEEVSQKKGEVRVLDVGGSRRYWKIVPDHVFDDLNMRFTVVNIPGDGQPQEETDRFSFQFGNGCDLEFKDYSFDIVHSNSVIEHVGGWNEMQAFARETRRLAPRYFVQTPYRYFPIEPHFMFPYFQLLPLSWRTWLMTKMDLGHHKTNQLGCCTQGS